MDNANISYDEGKHQSLPWSRVRIHSIINPFQRKSCLKRRSDLITVKSNINCSNKNLASTFFRNTVFNTISKSLSSTTFSDSKGKFTVQENIIDLEDDAHEEIDLISIEPYIRELTPELEKCLKISLVVNPPNDKDVEKHKYDLDRSFEDSKKPLLLLDLDETLIHLLGRNSPIISDNDMERAKEVKFQLDGRITRFEYIERPKLQEFLRELNQFYDISVRL